MGNDFFGCYSFWGFWLWKGRIMGDSEHFFCRNFWVCYGRMVLFFGVMWVNFCYYLFRLLETFVGIAMFSEVFGCLLDEFEKFVVWKNDYKWFFCLWI